MLRRLSVENYALIDQLSMELDPHLNIITGETGAGKSILLGALGLLLGAKNETSTIKDTQRNCIVEGVFDIAEHGLEPFFDKNRLEYAPETILTRIISPSGRSRAFINDMPVQLTQLRELGMRLVDIHSQHQNLLLTSEEFRTSALDTVAKNGDLLSKYISYYTHMVEKRRDLATLRQAAANRSREQEWLCFQCEELTAAALREGEQAEIEQELSILENAESIGEVFTALSGTLEADETGVLTTLKSRENDLRRIGAHYPAAAGYAERIHSVVEELKDIAGAVRSDSARIDTDPQRLSKLTARLDLLISLQQKHRAGSEAALIAMRNDYAERLAAIVRVDEAIEEVENHLAQATCTAEVLAAELHAAREKAASIFSSHILETLTQLGMAGAVFEVALTPQPELTRSGRDAVAFLFSANSDVRAQAVERIASGGELSRVMLALKALLAQRMRLPTVIFDEIDAGVSGRIADAMGEIIAQLAHTMQVVDITHLPQVASKGEAHFVVRKTGSSTGITRLTPQERVEEIAKMLSGSHITDAALTQARILLGKQTV